MGTDASEPKQCCTGFRAMTEYAGGAEPCRSPAVRGWNVCRMHGAGGGAPSGEHNGNYRHGGRTTETMAASVCIQALVRLTKGLEV
jgi:hypothetical protein